MTEEILKNQISKVLFAHGYGLTSNPGIISVNVTGSIEVNDHNELLSPIPPSPRTETIYKSFPLLHAFVEREEHFESALNLITLNGIVIYHICIVDPKVLRKIEWNPDAFPYGTISIRCSESDAIGFLRGARDKDEGYFIDNQLTYAIR